jgi:cytidylate kinase
MIITISGKPGSGKSTIANLLAKELKLKRYSVGDFRRNMAKKMGLTLHQLNKLGEKKEFTDRYADNWQVEIGKKEDNFIIDGRLSYHFIPNSIKIFFDVSPEVGSKRIMGDNGEEEKMGDGKMAVESWHKRVESDIKRYKKYYHLNPYDLKNYDCVLDTSKLTIEEVLKKIKDIINNKNKLKILAAGDIHGDSKLSERLAERAEKEKVDLVILTGDITGSVQTKGLIKPFIDRKQKVLFVPGNWETTEDAEDFSSIYGIKNLDKHYAVYKNVGIFGIGSKDWALFPDNQRTFKKLDNDFQKLKNLEKKIMISHLHAAGTKSELSGIPGNEGLRKAIDKFQPDIFIHSHIHELEGVEEKIGKTRVIHAGRRGKIIEL